MFRAVLQREVSIRARYDDEGEAALFPSMAATKDVDFLARVSYFEDFSLDPRSRVSCIAHCAASIDQRAAHSPPAGPTHDSESDLLWSENVEKTLGVAMAEARWVLA